MRIVKGGVTICSFVFLIYIVSGIKYNPRLAINLDQSFLLIESVFWKGMRTCGWFGLIGSLGEFSQDLKLLFGESPSDIVKSAMRLA